MAPDGEVFSADLGLHFVAADEHWVVEPFAVDPGSWVAFVPENRDPSVDPSIALAKILGTLEPPIGGEVRVLGKRIDEMTTRRLQRLRAEIGYVHSYGGLLNNRSVRDNIALPLSVHKRVRAEREGALVDELLGELDLATLANKRPFELSGAARWRTCVARAITLDPSWLVIEGLQMASTKGHSSVEWDCLRRRRDRYQLAMAVCFSRENPSAERWFERQGGEILRYTRAPRVRPTVRP